MTKPLDPKPGDPVSPAEFRVAALIAQDLPDKVVADRLGLSINTVRVHNQSLLFKLGVRSKVGVAIWWVQTGRYMPKPETPARAPKAPPVQRSPKVYVRMSDYVAARETA